MSALSEGRVRFLAPIFLALALWGGPPLAGEAPAATLNAPQQGPTVDSEEVIALAQRIKAALLRLQPCPSPDVARYAIGAAVEGVKLEVVVIALRLETSDDDLCRGARRGIAQALTDARLALASLSATGVSGGGSGGGGGGGSGPPRSPFSYGSFGGVPGGGGGSGYRPGS
jgi:hypothetical protein